MATRREKVTGVAVDLVVGACHWPSASRLALGVFLAQAESVQPCRLGMTTDQEGTEPVERSSLRASPPLMASPHRGIRPCHLPVKRTLQMMMPQYGCDNRNPGDVGGDNARVVEVVDSAGNQAGSKNVTTGRDSVRDGVTVRRTTGDGAGSRIRNRARVHAVALAAAWGTCTWVAASEGVASGGRRGPRARS